MTIQSKDTRFRAYQLGNAGSLFSYFDGTTFTLIEARYTDVNAETLAAELAICKKSTIDTLHITSWDQDHCSPTQLEKILSMYAPTKIEYPGYELHTDAGKASLKIIKSTKISGIKTSTTKSAVCPTNTISTKIVRIDPEYISSLDPAKEYGYNDIIYHPKFIEEGENKSNDNSTVKQFRSGSFNVLSLGDVESENIASGLRRLKSINREVDIMVLAHHGADNGFTTSSFLKTVRPKIAIATADYGNQFEHPKQEIRDLLHKNEIKLFTTKTGDVVVFSTNGHRGHYRIVNLKGGSTEVSSQYDFHAKKSKILGSNADTLRTIIAGKKNWPK